MTSAFEEMVVGLVSSGAVVSLEDLGGLDAISSQASTSPVFPYVASAIIDTYGPDSALPKVAADLIIEGVVATPSGLALADTCAAVVPAASRLGITPRLKDALRGRIGHRRTPAEAGMAAIALQALCHLAVLDDSARPSLLDVLTGISDSEEFIFAVAAARVAGIVFDHWRDPTAVQCLERLTASDAEADAWFCLGQVQLVSALEKPEIAEITAGLAGAVELLARAVDQGEDRPDACMYLGVVRFLSAWAAGAPAEELMVYLNDATEAQRAFWFGGLGMANRYGWYRPRFDAEVRWIELLRLMDGAARTVERSAWYHPATTIAALSDALEAAHTLQPAITALGQRETGLAEFVEPRLATPFMDRVADLAWLDQWLAENPGPPADRLSEAVRRRVQEEATRGKAPPGELSAIAELLGTEALSGEPESLLLRANQALLDRRAMRDAKRPRVISEIMREVAGALAACPDYVDAVRERFEELIYRVVLFLLSRMNVEMGGAAGRYVYLFSPDALEKELGYDLKAWLEGNDYPGTILAEVREIGGGRTDVIVQFGDFRLVIELKREQKDSSRESLTGYLPQAAAYGSTDVALGMLVVLDLTPKPTAPANVRDNVWVEVLPPPHPGERDRFVVTVRVPGNRKAPSDL